tara:strand:+ start:287 stop:667 length:381 start_codon:yes stop_codon:yes gene_type:complete
VTQDELLKLAERVEALDGPDRTTAEQVMSCFGWTNFSGPFATDPAGNRKFMPDPTASLDTAMSLVPEGWSVNIIRTADSRFGNANLYWFRDDNRIPAKKLHGSAATPALALCAAALRTKAQETDSE